MKPWDTHHFEEELGRLLRLGVIISGVVVLCGGVLYLIANGTSMPDYRMFKGERADLVSIHRVVLECLGGHPRALIQTGIVLLIATPFVRVLFSLAAFLKHKDWTYSAFTLIVFAILLVGLFGR